MDVPMVQRVWNVVTGSPVHPDQFPYIDSWLDIAQRLPPWVWFTYNRQRQAKVLLASYERRRIIKKKTTALPDDPKTSEALSPPTRRSPKRWLK